uniref:Uncharacterized protein n=1 Tax=Moniliophthora roreri TaxID=221103 RepID=A0A0W0F2W4_MONRR
MYQLTCRLPRPLTQLRYVVNLLKERGLCAYAKYPLPDWSSFDIDAVRQFYWQDDQLADLDLPNSNPYELPSPNYFGNAPSQLSVALSTVLGAWEYTTWEETTPLDVRMDLTNYHEFNNYTADNKSYPVDTIEMTSFRGF